MAGWRAGGDVGATPGGTMPVGRRRTPTISVLILPLVVGLLLIASGRASAAADEACAGRADPSDSGSAVAPRAGSSIPPRVPAVRRARLAEAVLSGLPADM